MGVIAHKGIIYGGGSDVEANPQDTATDDLEKVSIDGTVYDVTDADAVHTSDIGTANGVAELDANGLVPSSQLPSYVDDVLEYASLSAFPATGETGKIYVALDTNLTYRWSGSAYVEISPSLALGETSSTAYRGDRGKTAYDHATESGRSGAKSAGLYKIGVTAQGHVASATAVAKADLTALGVADQNDVDAIEEDIEGYKTVTGKYITVTDAASLPAESYSLTLSPVQDLNGYDSPWAAGAGKNKCDGTAYNAYINSGIPYIASLTPINSPYSITGNYNGVGFIVPVKSGVTYALSSDATGASELWFCGVYSTVEDMTDRANCLEYEYRQSDYTPSHDGFMVFMRYSMGTGTTVTWSYAQAEIGSTPTSFAPYSNICPIHGADEVGVRVRGKNFLQVQSNSGTFGQFTFTVNKDSDNNVVSITLNGTASETLYYQIMSGFVARQGIPYTLSGVPSGVSGIIIYNDNTGKMWRTSDTPTVTFDTETTMPIFIRVASGTTVSNVVLKPMIEIGSQATEFEPYKPTISTTITLPSTVYGGSVEQSGEGISEWKKVLINDLSISYNSTNNYFYSLLSDVLPPLTSNVKADIICECYAIDSANAVIYLRDFYMGVTADKYLVIKDSRYTNAADLKNAVGSYYICYKMATPTSLSVTPFPQTLLEGVNNVWAEMKENSTVIDNAQQSLSYQPQNIVGQLRQEINAKPDSFAELSDTSFSNLANGQIPKWNSTSQKWENANESGGGGSSSLADLSDTNISSPADGQILKWDGTSSKWVNANEYSYTLPTAAANTLGGIKVGSRLSIDANGVLSANDQSYTLPTASASTKGGVKIGDNLEMSGEVLSAKLPQWTKIWNYNSGATFSMPSGKTDIMLVIKVILLATSRIMSNVYPVEYPFSAGLVCSYTMEPDVWGGGTLSIGVTTSNTVTVTNTTELTSQNVDFEIWVR